MGEAARRGKLPLSTPPPLRPARIPVPPPPAGRTTSTRPVLVGTAPARLPDRLNRDRVQADRNPKATPTAANRPAPVGGRAAAGTTVKVPAMAPAATAIEANPAKAE